VVATAQPITPRAVLADFDWARVRRDDLVARWDDGIAFGP